jgi:hypothetical protein
VFFYHFDVLLDDGGAVGIDVVGKEGVESGSVVGQGDVHPRAVDDGGPEEEEELSFHDKIMV